MLNDMIKTGACILTFIHNRSGKKESQNVINLNSLQGKINQIATSITEYNNIINIEYL